VTKLVVTISATYGAGGTVVAPMVARRLGLPLLERVITPEVARAMRDEPAPAPGRETIPPEEQPDTGWRRLVDALARLPALFGSTMPQPDEPIDTEGRLRFEAERALRELVDTGGVVMGRAGMAVLRGEPHAFHVRLDGPVDARLRQGMGIEGINDEGEARRRLLDTDGARLAYVQRFYGCDPRNPSLYAMVLDSTAVPLETCADVIAEAAVAYRERMAGVAGVGG
jgi:cytidylate kinase